MIGDSSLVKNSIEEPEIFKSETFSTSGDEIDLDQIDNDISDIKFKESFKLNLI